jgi:hypothetical protein
LTLTRRYFVHNLPMRFLYSQVRLANGPPGGFHSIASAKQASVLFDEVLFEQRFFGLDLLLKGQGLQLHELSPDEIDNTHRRRLAEWSETSDFFIDDPQAPPMGHGTYNELHRILPELGCDWVRAVVGRPDSPPKVRQHPDEHSVRHELRAVAAAHGATVFGGVGRPLPLGGRALGILVPDIQLLPWEAIAEFREHAGSREARHRLRDFDSHAQDGHVDIHDEQRFEQQIANEITRALMAAWSETRPKLAPDLAKEAMRVGIGLIPLAGPPLSTASSIAESAYEIRRNDRSWIAAMWDLVNSPRL